MKNNFADEKSNDDAKDRLIAELRAENERLRELQGKAHSGVLTDAKIAKLSHRGLHRDCKNLYIQVTNVDAKTRSWVIRWASLDAARAGKIDAMGIGSYPDVSIQAAREEARLARQDLRDGKNPRLERAKRKQGTIVASGLIMTVRQVAVEWFNTKIKSKNPKYARKIENQLNRYVYGTVGNILVEQIDQKTITDDAEPNTPRVGLNRLLREMWPTGKDVQSHLERIFDYAIYKGYSTKANPAAWATLQHVVPNKEDVYERQSRNSLPIDEAYDFLQKLRAVEDRSDRKTGHPMLALLNEAIAYTGCRISELIEAQQREFDFDTMTWNAPWQHRKNGKRKKVKRPILPRAITPLFKRVLDQAATRRKELGLADHPNMLVFPSDKQSHIGKMIKTSSPSVFIQRNFPGLKLHPHGWRSTLRDWRRLRGSRFEDVLWKLQVDHNAGDDASDDAYGPDLLLERRRPMMMEYDKFLSKPPPAKAKTGNVFEAKTGKIVNLNNQRRTA
jgi:integrase